jgi:hypothetical protein
METGAKWRFVTHGDGDWRWMVLGDGTEALSDSAFRSIEDCMADAAQHGYANYHPTEAAYP